jgi:hypothetical protein
MHDWAAGWQEFIEGDDYNLLSPPQGLPTRSEADEFARQLQKTTAPNQ